MTDSHIQFLPHRKLRQCWSILFLLLLFGGHVAAQDLEEKTTEGRQSPQATMSTLILNMNLWVEDQDKEALALAVATLDLSEIPVGLRAKRGEELATLLKFEVIDKDALVDLESLPDYSDGPAYVHVRTGIGSVVIDKTEDGDWKFTTSTVASIEDLAVQFEGRGVAEGVRPLVPASEWFRSLWPQELQEHGMLDLYWWQWLGIALLILFALLGGRILVFLLTGLTGKILKKFGVEPSESDRHRMILPLAFAFAAVAWWVFDSWLILPTGVYRPAIKISRIVFGLGIIVFLMRLVDQISVRVAAWAATTESKYDDLLVPFIRKSSKVVIVIFGTMTILETLNLDLTSALAGLGIGGLAFALAAKDTISNLFGSITVIADRPFQIGDWIQVGEVEGSVESLGFRSTRVRTFYNSLMTVPNANLISAVVDNYGERQYRRYKTYVSVTYNTPPDLIETFCEGIRELLLEHPYTRKDYFHVYLHAYSAASLDILVYMFFDAPDWGTELRERHRLNVDIIRLAHRLGVDFAFPTQTLYLERGKGRPAPDERTYPTDSEIEAFKAKGRAAAEDLVLSTIGPKGTIPPPVSAGTGRQKAGELSLSEGE